ncbi:hypothetical protein ACFYSI_13120 [Staphylococcus xylosus]|uniref:hypothetical protein n=1 Tax=Staphylococcus xylosus TaxID=1288 RepID=UPI00367D08DF
MQEAKNLKVIINFINKDKGADVIGYLNLPPCRPKDKQYPLFIKNGELYANYKSVQLNISDYLYLDDAIEVDTVLNWNDWSYQSSHVVVELNNEEIMFL